MTAMDSDAKLIYMVNQIARNFAALGHDHAISATLDHVVHYWDPRMKARIVVLGGEGGDALSPAARAAVAGLAAGVVPAPQTRASRSGGSDAG